MPQKATARMQAVKTSSLMVSALRGLPATLCHVVRYRHADAFTCGAMQSPEIATVSQLGVPYVKELVQHDRQRLIRRPS